MGMTDSQFVAFRRKALKEYNKLSKIAKEIPKEIPGVEELLQQLDELVAEAQADIEA